MTDSRQTKYVVFLPPSPGAIKRDVSHFNKTAWPKDAASGRQKSGKAKWRRIDRDGRAVIASSREVEGYSVPEREESDELAVDGEASRAFSPRPKLRGCPELDETSRSRRVQRTRNSASSSKSVSDAIPSAAGPTPPPTTNPTTTTGDTRDPFQITPSTGRIQRSEELPQSLSGRMKAVEDSHSPPHSQPHSQSLPFHHSASVVPSSSDDEVGQLMGGSNKQSQHERSGELRSSSPLADQIFPVLGARALPQQPRGHQEDSADTRTDAMTTLSIELPRLKLHFHPLKFLSVGNVIANATRYVPSHYLDPNNLRHEGFGFGGAGPGAAAGDQRFSVLALVRDVGPLQDERIWRKKAGRPGGGGGDVSLPDTMEICEVQLMGANMEPLTLILQHSLAGEWAGEEESEESYKTDADSLRGLTASGMPSATTTSARATPDAGGVTMALMETMDTSAAGGALKGKGQHQRLGARPGPILPKDIVSSGARLPRPVKIRAGDVVALSGLTLKPIIPKKESRVKQLGVTRRMQPVNPTVGANAQGQTPWEGVRAIANGENDLQQVNLEVCWRNDVRSKADEKFCFDPAFAQFDARYERVHELALLWEIIKPRYA